MADLLTIHQVYLEMTRDSSFEGGEYILTIIKY